MSVKVHVILINPSGTLVAKTQILGALAAGALEIGLKSALQVVGVWVERSEDENGNPGPWWDEYTGNSAYAVQENSEGVGIFRHDTTPTATKTRQFNNDHSMAAQRQIDNSLAQSVMGQGACWDVLDDGSGSYYTQKVGEAKALIGAP